jgi:predicted RNA-binding protein associated with RNAse of E/G family
MPFEPGRPVLYRNLGRGQLFAVRPCRVVSDDDRGLLLWLARGSVVGVEVAADGRGIRSMPFAEWVRLDHRMIEATWQGPGILKFFPPDVDHSVWFFFGDGGSFAGWYVNLEERAVRWDDGDLAGVDTVDQDLDVVVAPDRSWQWKDEDEFAERLALPDHYWVPDEAAVWAEGRRVIKRIEAGEFPFDGTWTDFVPDPSWPVPRSLPPGWDRPPASL